MNENKELTVKNPLTSVSEFLTSMLSIGVIIASTHGALLPVEHHQKLSPSDFTAKVIHDLHVHNDFQVQKSHVLADPKHLRNVRSEGDKVAERDGLGDNWDVYCS